jgi:hypothetical protein
MEEVKTEKPKGKGGMMILLLLLIPVISIALRATGKKAESPAPVAEPGTDAAAAAAILRKIPPSTVGGPAGPARRLVKDAKEWEGLWKQVTSHRTPASKAPHVDFSKEMVAFTALGSKPVAGWAVEIVGSRVEGGKLVVLYSETEPAEKTGPGRSSPWHAVVFAKSDLPVEWTKYEAPKVAPAKPK